MKQSSNECPRCPAFKACPFKAVGTDVMAAVNQFKYPGTAPAGHVIAAAGERLPGPICIGSGILRAEFTGSSGKRHLLRFFVPGDLVGMADGFMTMPLAYDLVADTPSSYCLIPGQELSQASARCKPLCDEIVRRMSEEAQSSLNRTKLLMEKRADQRIAAALIEFERLGRPFIRRELAEWAATTVENVIRTIAKFDHEGWVRRDREKLRILDRKTLETMAAL